MIRRRGWWWRLVPLALSAVLLLAIVNVWWGGETALTESPADKGLKIPKPPGTGAKSPLSAYQVVVQQNLFDPSRQGEEAAGKTPASLEAGKLLGTIIIGPEKAALITGSSPRPSSEIHVIRPGERWGSLDILEINDGIVEIRDKEGKKVLQVFEPSDSGQGGRNEGVSEKDEQD